MKIYLISDNTDTLTGMRLAGIDGVVVHEKEDFVEALSKAVNDEEIGIILVTEHLSLNFPDLVKEIKLSRRALPLLAEIPDRHGSLRPVDFVTEYIREAIGVKL